LATNTQTTCGQGLGGRCSFDLISLTHIMYSKRLSICIPTYNRALFLKQCVESFLPEARKYDIPIFISDNAFSDNTGQVVAKLRETYENIFYSRNDTMIEGNPNKVISLSDTQYSWLFADDDAVQGSVIGKVLSALDKGADLVVVNGSTNSLDLSTAIEDRRLNIFQDKVYEPGEHERFMIDNAFYLTFIGGLIVNRNKFLDLNAKPIVGKYFRHVAVVLNYVVGVRAYVIAEPHVKIRLQNSGWSTMKFEILMIDWPKTIWSLPGEYSDAAKSKVVQRRRVESVNYMLASRANRMYDQAVYDKYIKDDPHISAVKKCLFRVVASLPVQIFRLMLYIYLNVTRTQGYKLKLNEMKYS
jgi:abequosyltransferase